MSHDGDAISEENEELAHSSVVEEAFFVVENDESNEQ